MVMFSHLAFFSQNVFFWQRCWSERTETLKGLECFNNKNLLYKDKAILEPCCMSTGTMNWYWPKEHIFRNSTTTSRETDIVPNTVCKLDSELLLARETAREMNFPCVGHLQGLYAKHLALLFRLCGVTLLGGLPKANTHYHMTRNQRESERACQAMT